MVKVTDCKRLFLKYRKTCKYIQKLTRFFYSKACKIIILWGRIIIRPIEFRKIIYKSKLYNND
jgi:hypothetical protein